MFVAKLKIAALMVFTAGALIVGGMLSHTLTAAPQAKTKTKDPPSNKKDADKPETKPITVSVVKPKPGGLARTANVNGQFIADQQQRIAPRISGTVKQVNVDIGDRVKKGQTLIVLDAPLIAKEWKRATSAFEMAQLKEQEAEAQVATAEAELEVAEVLYKMKLAVKSEIPGAGITIAAGDVKIKKGRLAQAKAALKTAGAAVRTAHAVMDIARTREGFTRIVAAFDGVVTRLTIDPGNFVQASDSRLLTPLLTVQRTDRLRFRGELSVRDAAFIGRGDPVDLDVDDLAPVVHLPAQKIARFNPTIHNSGNAGDTLTVEVDVANLDGRLMPGMSSRVTIHFQKRLSTALVVPQSCLCADQHPLYGPIHNEVYIVRDGKAYRNRVKVTAEDEKNAEISEGVKASDLIVTNPKVLKGDIVPVEIEKTTRRSPE